MTDAISGKFDYNSLKNRLKKEGVKGTEMNAALRQIAVDNHIDNIKDLDKSKEIKIASSIFKNEETQSPFNLNPIQAIGNLFSFNNQNNNNAGVVNEKIFNVDSSKKMPEIYNDDEYEVVDYDDFYNFGDESNTVQPHTMEYKINLDGPQKPGDPNPLNSEQMPSFNPGFEQLSSDFTFNQNQSNPLMNDGMFSFQPSFDKNYSTEVNDKDREDLLANAMQMDMDMSNDAFNA